MSKKVILIISIIFSVALILHIPDSKKEENHQIFLPETSQNILEHNITTEEYCEPKTMIESMIENGEPQHVIDDVRDRMRSRGEDPDDWMALEDGNCIFKLEDGKIS